MNVRQEVHALQEAAAVQMRSSDYETITECTKCSFSRTG